SVQLPGIPDTARARSGLVRRYARRCVAKSQRQVEDRPTNHPSGPGGPVVGESKCFFLVWWNEVRLIIYSRFPPLPKGSRQKNPPVVPLFQRGRFEKRKRKLLCECSRSTPLTEEFPSLEKHVLSLVEGRG